MKMKPVNHDDLMALYDDTLPPRGAGGKTVRGRRAKEKPPVKPTDGRRVPTKGRSQQFNTNLTPDLFERMDHICERYGLTKAEFTELAFNAAIVLLNAHGAEALQRAGMEPSHA